MGIFTGYQLAKADKEAREDKQATQDLAERRMKLAENQFSAAERERALRWMSDYTEANDKRNVGAKEKAKMKAKLLTMQLDSRTADYLIGSGEAPGIIDVFNTRSKAGTISKDWIGSIVKKVDPLLDDESSPQAKALAVKTALLSAADQSDKDGQYAALLEVSFNIMESGIVPGDFNENVARAIAGLNLPEPTIALTPIGSLTSGSQAIGLDQTKKIRSLLDENSSSLSLAGPSMPVLISGLDSPPRAGEEFVVVTSEKMAKEISRERAKKVRESRLARKQITNLESLFDSEKSSNLTLNLLIKADTYGSLEAILGSLKNFESEEIKLNIIHYSVGGINTNDVNLAITTNSIIIGFNVRTDNSSKKLADAESIEISYYGIIYDLLDGIKEIIEGHLEPEIRDEILGTAEVKETFKSPQFGVIAGSFVLEGTIKRNKFARVIRDDIVIFEGRLDSLRRFKDDASEVSSGTECGIGIENYSDIKVGDKIEVFDKKEIRRTLS